MFFSRFFSACSRTHLAPMAILVASLAFGGARAHAAPPQLYDADVPTQVVVGSPVTFRVGFKDPDGDKPKTFTCTVDGPGGTQKKEYAPGGGQSPNAVSGFIADFPMGTFSLDGQYSVRFAATTGDGSVETPTQKFVVVNLTRRWYELALGVAACLIALPLLVFLLMRIVAPRTDPRAAARFGLIAGVGASYAWYIYLFGALHQGIGIGVGALVTLAAIVALLSGVKSSPKTR